MVSLRFGEMRFIRLSPLYIFFWECLISLWILMGTAIAFMIIKRIFLTGSAFTFQRSSCDYRIQGTYNRSGNRMTRFLDLELTSMNFESWNSCLCWVLMPQPIRQRHSKGFLGNSSWNNNVACVLFLLLAMIAPMWGIGKKKKARAAAAASGFIDVIIPKKKRDGHINIPPLVAT